MKLSILIPTLPSRADMFCSLCEKLLDQKKPFNEDDIEILVSTLEDPTIGAKRNMLLERATGEYIAYIDDDDDVSDDYIKLLMEGIEKNIDCCSLTGKYYINGKFDAYFEHSLIYKEWKTNYNLTKPDQIKYERFPNHLNCIKTSIAKQFWFPKVNHGEDKDWSTQIHESGLLRTEHYIDSVIYHYYKTTK